MQEGILKTIDMLGQTVENQGIQLNEAQATIGRQQARIDELEKRLADSERGPQNDVLSGPRDSA